MAGSRRQLGSPAFSRHPVLLIPFAIVRLWRIPGRKKNQQERQVAGTELVEKGMGRSYRYGHRKEPLEEERRPVRAGWRPATKKKDPAICASVILHEEMELPAVRCCFRRADLAAGRFFASRTSDEREARTAAGRYRRGDE